MIGFFVPQPRACAKSAARMLLPTASMGLLFDFAATFVGPFQKPAPAFLTGGLVIAAPCAQCVQTRRHGCGQN